MLMKRLFSVIVISLLLLCSCRGEYGILEYQEKIESVSCLVNGKFEIVIRNEGDTLTLEILKPEKIKGVQFKIGQSAEIIYNDIQMTVEKQNLKGICALGNMFSLNESDLACASEQENGSSLSFATDYGYYTVELNQNSTPSKITVTAPEYTYTVEILSITQSP